MTRTTQVLRPTRPAQTALVLCAAAAAATAVACDRDELSAGAGGVTVCPTTNVIGEPPQLQWTYHPVSAGNPQPYYSGTLELGQATFTIGGQTLTTRAYRQAGTAYTIPGPTLKMTPGNKYVLRFHNTLPYQPASTAHNVFKDPNVSNLHTHGLHISAESPSDDVMRFFEGGYGGDFVYDIPADHMGGTYWYHAHHHGSTYLQVSGGAFGQIIIDDGNDGLPPNVAAMTERQLVIAYLDPSVAGTGGDTIVGGNLAAGWTVNGTRQGSLCTSANEWQHWRVLLADRSATEKTLGIGAGCEVELLARDGVWRTTAPKALPTRAISLTGASRADLAVRCTSDSTITINGSTVASVLVGPAGNTAVGPYSGGSTGGTWSAIRPVYLRDLRGAASVHNEVIRMGARALNGMSFDMDVPNLTLPANQIQHWGLSGNTQHPFHLHIYHVQSVDCTGSFEPGEYYDVITQPCSVRFDLNAATSSVYEGRTIMHCHILEHEDQGAMGWMDVVGGRPPPTFPADGSLATPYAEKYSLGAMGPACGDGTCSGGETRCSCPADCGVPPTAETVCADGLDNDCDGALDCADTNCATVPACAPPACDGDGTCEAGESCTNCPADCASVTTGPTSQRYCCGDGVMQAAEGNGTVCDGNY
ncbi:MAG TPA: multicopper oxidase family protein [Kofleriaceae bacterium]|nr:multicopper oxidase family protein [Kofleriaceae bacterium]